jgi:hypothetical protein
MHIVYEPGLDAVGSRTQIPQPFSTCVRENYYGLRTICYIGSQIHTQFPIIFTV